MNQTSSFIFKRRGNTNESKVKFKFYDITCIKMFYHLNMKLVIWIVIHCKKKPTFPAMDHTSLLTKYGQNKEKCSVRLVNTTFDFMYYSVSYMFINTDCFCFATVLCTSITQNIKLTDQLLYDKGCKFKSYVWFLRSFNREGCSSFKPPVTWDLGLCILVPFSPFLREARTLRTYSNPNLKGQEPLKDLLKASN